jgi:hypothetical protein
MDSASMLYTDSDPEYQKQWTTPVPPAIVLDTSKTSSMAQRYMVISRCVAMQHDLHVSDSTYTLMCYCSNRLAISKVKVWARDFKALQSHWLPKLMVDRVLVISRVNHRLCRYAIRSIGARSIHASSKCHGCPRLPIQCHTWTLTLAVESLPKSRTTTRCSAMPSWSTSCSPPRCARVLPQWQSQPNRDTTGFSHVYASGATCIVLDRTSCRLPSHEARSWMPERSPIPTS